VSEDSEVWRFADALIRRHGDDASFWAAQRADQCLADGDTDGARLWRAVIRAIEEVQRARGHGDRVN
jgi:hypothetical protein